MNFKIEGYILWTISTPVVPNSEMYVLHNWQHKHLFNLIDKVVQWEDILNPYMTVLPKTADYFGDTSPA